MSDERENNPTKARVIDAFAGWLEASPRLGAGLVAAFVSLSAAVCSSPHRHETTVRPTASTDAAQRASPIPTAPSPEVAPHDLTPDARAPAAETVRAASDVEALVHGWANERGPLPDGREPPASLPRVEVVVLGPELALATVATECHATGGYDAEATVVDVRRGRVMPARFETPPRNPYRSPDDLLPRPVETGRIPRADRSSARCASKPTGRTARVPRVLVRTSAVRTASQMAPTSAHGHPMGTSP